MRIIITGFSDDLVYYRTAGTSNPIRENELNALAADRGPLDILSIFNAQGECVATVFAVYRGVWSFHLTYECLFGMLTDIDTNIEARIEPERLENSYTSIMTISLPDDYTFIDKEAYDDEC